MTGQQDVSRARVGGITGTIDGPMTVAPALTRHEQMYRDACGDPSRLPWEDGCADPLLISWMNAEAPGLIRPGARAVVVGCGLGDEVRELTDRGYDAVGFDCAPTAISWARQRHPDLSRSLFQADLLDPPPKFRHRFDLVVEVNTLQSMHTGLRESAARSLASLVTPHGVVLAVCCGRDDVAPLDETQGPPFPFAPAELTRLLGDAGMRPLRPLEDISAGGKRRLRGAFVRA